MYNVKAVKLMLIEKQTFIEFQKNIIYLRFLKFGLNLVLKNTKIKSTWLIYF